MDTLQIIEVIQQLAILMVTISFAIGIIAIICFAIYYELQNVKLAKRYIETIEEANIEEDE